MERESWWEITLVKMFGWYMLIMFFLAFVAYGYALYAYTKWTLACTGALMLYAYIEEQIKDYKYHKSTANDKTRVFE